ncbi:MAG: A24 family peptidase [Planctomycetaceae bacterium]
MLLYLTSLAAGCVLGRIAAAWAALMVADSAPTELVRCSACGEATSAVQVWASLASVRCRNCGRTSKLYWPLLTSLSLGLLFAAYCWLLLDAGGGGCQRLDEVQPSAPLSFYRLPFHFALLFLMTVAVVTDFLDYVIPDAVIVTGILVAITGAFATGELQIIHIWVNWDDVIPGIQGPYLPEWMKNHQHLHGLAWSSAGLVVGATLTWLIRFSSHLVLGYPALGFGDVTLMAMIGAFIGWQPVLCVLGFAPLAGLIVGLVTRIVSGRSFVAYGPYLAASAVIVLCTWRWLWADFFTLRDIFSHWPSVAGLVAGAWVTLLVLLLLLRGFRSLPANRLRH